MINIRDLRIDNASLGDQLLLVDVTPIRAYQDNVRTDTISGYRYTVCLPAHKLERLAIKIDGAQQMDAPDGYVPVVLDNLVVTAYEMQGKVQITARATAIKPAAT